MTDKKLNEQSKISANMRVANDISDEELFGLCQKYGKMALESRRKFAGLLPEVFTRKLYEKKGYSSVFEFAAKMAGMSHEQVNLVLKLEKKLEDKPVLREALVSGEISANKLIRVVSIATVENQEELFEKIKVLSNRAIEVLVRDVRDVRDVRSEKSETPNGFQNPLFSPKSMHVHRIKLAEDVEKELFEMQEKGIDINEFLRKILNERKEKIEEKKNEVAEEQRLHKAKKEVMKEQAVEKINCSEGLKPSRYIPAKIRKIIREEHGTKCSYPGCLKIAKTLHHTRRFALTRDHDPHFIAPLCEAHHEIAHKIDVRFTEKVLLLTNKTGDSKIRVS